MTIIKNARLSPPPHPQHNVDVDSCKVDRPFKHCSARGRGGGLNNDFLLQNNALAFFASVRKTFGQDCKFDTYVSNTSSVIVANRRHKIDYKLQKNIR